MAMIAAAGAVAATVAGSGEDSRTDRSARAERPLVLSTDGYRELSVSSPRLAEAASERRAERRTRASRRRARAVERAAVRMLAARSARPAPTTVTVAERQSAPAEPPAERPVVQSAPAPAPRAQVQRPARPQQDRSGVSGGPARNSQAATWSVDGVEGSATRNASRPSIVLPSHPYVSGRSLESEMGKP